jgi:hypothetical protein
MRDTRGLADPVTLSKVLEEALGVKLDTVSAPKTKKKVPKK